MLQGVLFECFSAFASESGHGVLRESPRQTKPKKGQFMNFSPGHSGTKVRYVNRACFPKEKHQNSQKWAEFMNFSFRPFLWFGLPGRPLESAFQHFGSKKRRKALKKHCLGHSEPGAQEHPQALSGPGPWALLYPKNLFGLVLTSKGCFKLFRVI